MKKGRHRRYEEARALKRGSDLDIESIFSDLSDERVETVEIDDDDESDEDSDTYGRYDDEGDFEAELADEVERR